MAIPTTRTQTAGVIQIDEDLCTSCGNCIEVCKDFSIEQTNGKIQISNNSVFGCIGCGHCMAVCPTGAIEVTGREMSSEMLFDLPPRSMSPNFNQLLSLVQRRRSIREFTDQDVEEEKIKQILQAAQTAPMGLPPSDVNVLLLNGKEQVKNFSLSFSIYLETMKWMVSPIFLSLMRPFWGKPNDELFKNFVRPLFKTYVEQMKNGNNYIMYDAPLAMYFYGSPYSDPADPIVAATYAMLAGESLGLGTCMLGAIHPLIQNGKKAAAFRKKHSIKHKSREGLFVIFGYPSVSYHKGILRTFASTTTI